MMYFNHSEEKRDTKYLVHHQVNYKTGIGKHIYANTYTLTITGERPALVVFLFSPINELLQNMKKRTDQIFTEV